MTIPNKEMLFLKNNFFIVEENLTLLWNLYLEVLKNTVLTFRGDVNETV